MVQQEAPEYPIDGDCVVRHALRCELPVRHLAPVLVEVAILVLATEARIPESFAREVRVQLSTPSSL